MKIDYQKKKQEKKKKAKSPLKKDRIGKTLRGIEKKDRTWKKIYGVVI